MDRDEKLDVVKCHDNTEIRCRIGSGDYRALQNYNTINISYKAAELVGNYVISTVSIFNVDNQEQEQCSRSPFISYP
jgi:hypothetical protein